MYRDRMKGWMKHGDFLLLDIICLQLSFLIAYSIKLGIPYDGLPKTYRDMMLIITLSDICVVFFANSYKDIIYRGYLLELKQVFYHNLFVECGVVLWLFVTRQSLDYSRLVIISMCPISICIMICVRLAWKRLIRNQIRDKRDLRRVFVITTKQRAEHLIDGLLQPYRDYQIIGLSLYDASEKAGEFVRGVPIVADKDSLIEYIQKNVIDEIFLDLKGYEEEEEKYKNLFINMGIIVHINLAETSIGMENKAVHSYGKYIVLTSGMKFADPRKLLIKRLTDICGALVGLVAAAIICIIFGPIIYYQSPGSIFFAQERVGRNGRTFKLYKLRTMYPDAEERKKELMDQNKMKGLMFKMDNDPRIIPIGHFLRKTSLDEFPQFWNVLRGDMSLVGTRPPTVDEYKQYETQHKKRLAIKPGITGLWQVSGRSNIVDFEEVVALDAKYITDWSLREDLKILWKTVLIVVKGKGAV